MDTKEAVARAKEVDWFGSVGNPVDSSIQALASWDDWIGPEDDLVTAIHYQQQEYLETIVGDETEQQSWHYLVSNLVDHIKTTAPFEENGDSWAAPNMAVWHAAWTFALKFLYENKGLTVPPEITIQMHWFENGRWPCSLTTLESKDVENGYVIL